MKNVLSKVGLDVHKEKVLLALITPHINDERFCISTVHIIRMSFSASKILLLLSLLWLSRVCVCACS